MFDICFFFQADDCIRDAQESRGLGDVYKRQPLQRAANHGGFDGPAADFDVRDAGNKPGDNQFFGMVEYVGRLEPGGFLDRGNLFPVDFCLLYTSDAADELLCVDLGGRRSIKKKK